MQNPRTRALVNHISRVEGQLAALKRELHQEHPDCEKASDLLTATSRSFASLRRAFVECFLAEGHAKPRGKKSGGPFESLMRVISS